MLADERFSDRPGSVCPVIGAILRAYNDNTVDALRQDLYRYAADVVGTRGSFELQRERAVVALAWAAARYEVRARRWYGLRRAPAEPDPSWGPDLIAEHVIGSLGSRITPDTHRGMLSLLDRLLAVGAERELVEHLPEPIEYRGGGEELPVAEVVECGAPSRLELLPAPLDYLSSTLGQGRQDQALVLV